MSEQQRTTNENDVFLRKKKAAAGAGPVMVPVGMPLPADSPRLDGENRDHIRLLAEATAPLPPILVHRSTMRVIDGMHRLRAAMLRGDTEIAVEFFDGTEMEAFARAVRENVTHGLPLSRADREAAAARIIASHGEWSNRAAAEATGLSPTTVAAIRARSSDQAGQSNTRVGRDGRRRPVDPAEGRMKAQALLATRPGASLREIASESGISISTALDVRRRIERGEDPVRRTQNSGKQPMDAEAAAADRTYPILQSLRMDPSLRFSETGRTLLQWLSVHEMTTGDTGQVIESIPEHCRENVAKLAWSCAEIWRQLAQTLQQNTPKSDGETRESA
jgi:ParB-like chromosome segregation protein Spo0J